MGRDMNDVKHMREWLRSIDDLRGRELKEAVQQKFRAVFPNNRSGKPWESWWMLPPRGKAAATEIYWQGQRHLKPIPVGRAKPIGNLDSKISKQQKGILSILVDAGRPMDMEMLRFEVMTSGESDIEATRSFSASMSRALRELQHRGLILRLGATHRTTLIALTEAGWALAETIFGNC
jgi:hypothetical protein